MSYYPTIEEDLKRAKEILEKGRAPGLGGWPLVAAATGGTIYGADTYAAYQLLESFVAEIEALQSGVATAAASAVALQQQLAHTQTLAAQCAGELARSLAENLLWQARLRQALDEWEYACTYKGEYFTRKHGDAEHIAELRAFLDPALR